MFITDLSIEEYNQLAIDTNNQHFLHSVRWAEFRKHINWEYKIVGYRENDQLTIGAVVMMKKAGRLPFKVAYSSRGYVKTDGADEKSFTHELKKYLKKQGAFVYKIDPNEIYAELNKELKPETPCNQQRVDDLIALGYEHLGFVNNFEGMQPRHTIRIDTTVTYDEALKRMDAKTRNRTKAGKKNGLVIEDCNFNMLPTFMNILAETSQRDNFTIRDISYFEEMYKVFGDDLKLRLAKVDFAAAIEKLSIERDNVESELNQLLPELDNPEMGAKYRKKLTNRINEFEAKIAKNTKVIDEFTAELVKYPEGKYIGGSIYICEGKRAWYIYGATSDSFRYMLPSYALVAYMIEQCIDNDFEYFDMFGIGGDFDPSNHVFGLYDFKKGFGGQAIEFIGEFDLPINKPLYWGFDKLYPKLKAMRKGSK